MIAATLQAHMGTCEDVADAARVSFAKKASGFTPEQNERLINFLAREGHYAPFGHNYAKFHIKAPIFVARQLVKHKFLRMSEISRRYVKDEPQFYQPVWRELAHDKKQGSGSDVDSIVQQNADIETDAFNMRAVKSYYHLLGIGICEEQARMVLPVSMYTEWVWSGSLDAFANMCNLRLKADTQYESQLVAQQINQQMSTVFPISWNALIKEGT